MTNDHKSEFGKVTIRPGFFGTVPSFNDLSQKKNHSLPGTPICPVFGLVSQISPDLLISAAVCLCIGGQKLIQILSVAYIRKKSLPMTPKSDPRRLTPAALTPYDSRLWRSSRIAVPKLWSPY